MPGSIPGLGLIKHWYMSVLIHGMVAEAADHKLRLRALKLDLMSQIQTADNFFEDYECCGVFEGKALYQHRRTMAHVCVPLEEVYP